MNLSPFLFLKTRSGILLAASARGSLVPPQVPVARGQRRCAAAGGERHLPLLRQARVDPRFGERRELSLSVVPPVLEHFIPQQLREHSCVANNVSQGHYRTFPRGPSPSGAPPADRGRQLRACAPALPHAAHAVPMSAKAELRPTAVNRCNHELKHHSSYIINHASFVIHHG